MTERRRAVRLLVSFVATAALVFFLGSVMLDFFARQMLYPAPPFRVGPPPPSLEEVVLAWDDGEAVAWAGHRDDPAAPAVLFFHGNGENLETMRLSGVFEDLARLGVHFLAVDYPGYGKSRGTPTEASLVASGRAGFAWLAERHPESPKVVVGWSLGAAVAIQVASAVGEEADRLALLSAWDDLPTLAASHFPRWLVGAALPDRWDSLSLAPGIQRPTLLVHGQADDIIPVDHGRRLHAGFSNGARFVAVPGAGHNDLLGRGEVWRELRAFLSGGE